MIIGVTTLRDHGSPCACYPIMAAGTAVGPVRRAAARPRPSMTRLTRWAATGRGSATGSSSKSWSRSCGSAARMSRSPTAPAAPPRSASGATSGSRPGSSRKLKTIARESYDRIVGLALDELAVDGCITKAPGGGECAGRSPVDRAETGHEAVAPGRGQGHPARPGPGPREPARLPAAGPHPGQTRRHSARCPMASPSTSTPATTRRRPATSFKPAA